MLGFLPGSHLATCLDMVAGWMRTVVLGKVGGGARRQQGLDQAPPGQDNARDLRLESPVATDLIFQSKRGSSAHRPRSNGSARYEGLLRTKEAQKRPLGWEGRDVYSLQLPQTGSSFPPGTHPYSSLTTLLPRTQRGHQGPLGHQDIQEGTWEQTNPSPS